MSELLYLEYTGGRLRSLADEQLENQAVQRQVRARMASFLNIPFVVGHGSHLVSIIHERVARQVAPALPRLRTRSVDGLDGIIEAAFWHPRHDDDPTHRWIRNKIAMAVRKL